MARLEPLSAERETNIDVRELLYWAEMEGSPDPRLVRIYARTEVGIAYLRAWRSALFGGQLPLRLKELVRIRFVATEECGYCSSMKTPRAMQEGVTMEALSELSSYETSPLFDERERAALRFGDLWRRDAIGTDEVFADLRRHFSDDEIVELGTLLSMVEGSRFVKALDVVSWGDACEVDSTLLTHKLEVANVR
jgi:AhpD family alkylhydroperoxidase